MKEYQVSNIRNVVLVGHGGSGKTSMSEALLHDSGATSRFGRVEEKNTVSDYDEEEQSRGLSVNASVLPTEWRDNKINIVDAPGYIDFIGEVVSAIRATDAGILLIDAAAGVEVGAELHWNFMNAASLPRIVFINKMDRDNASFARTLEQLGNKFDGTFVPIQIPVGSHESFNGVIDLINMKVYLGAENKEADIPADLRAAADDARLQMMEHAAESDDELMMKYLEGEELTNDEIRTALAAGSRSGKLILVMTGSATQNIGMRQLLDAVVDFMPDPTGVERKAINEATQQEEALKVDPASPLVVQVFKTMADPFVGKITYFRVYSGTLSADSRMMNANKREEERVGQVYMTRGKEQTPVSAVKSGDIGVVAKLSVTTTGDTLVDRGAPYRMPEITYPEPLYSAAVFPKTSADLDKLGTGLSRLVEEDPTLRVERNAETSETILSGMGESHIQIAARRLAQKFGVDITTDVPTIPYRETITKAASAQGRHKKQTGGRGQFGDIWCRFEPLERGAGFEFTSEIFGGSVPKQYIPAVEKGMREILPTGVLAGFPTVDIRCIITDGSYHAVDSSELAFKLAAHLAFKAAIPQAGPVLLEPVMDVVITVPDNFMGDILGDLNTRRARILGMEQSRGNGIVTAQVPLAEIQRYATDLRSMTQGRGIYTMKFSHYDVVPSQLVDKIRDEAAKKRQAQQ